MKWIQWIRSMFENFVLILNYLDKSLPLTLYILISSVKVKSSYSTHHLKNSMFKFNIFYKFVNSSLKSINLKIYLHTLKYGANDSESISIFQRASWYICFIILVCLCNDRTFHLIFIDKIIEKSTESFPNFVGLSTVIANGN